MSSAAFSSVSTFVAATNRAVAYLPLIPCRSNGTSTLFVEDSDAPVEVPLDLHGISGRYATALFVAATKVDTLEKAAEDMRKLKHDLSKPAGALTMFIRIPIIKKDEKAKILREAALAAGMTNTIANFLEIVAENNRLKHLKLMVNQFDELMKSVRGEVVVRVTSAINLDEEQTANLQETLEKFLAFGDKPQMELVVDPSIIGGLIIKIGDRLIDMSVARKIEYYKKLMSIPVYK
ncbi:ATP synthase subunit O, mitochondrial-like [Ctenocephalides felis]|uniref:ATP synthase subunit O, mitochondrial-like n=1 Tax=Ctenocephalides felis TaxID=7515 RepID=UPI000E6E549C|nr:ATP synthase subunit O, mitochondrial-like [Ctenocephalides felis]